MQSLALGRYDNLILIFLPIFNDLCPILPQPLLHQIGCSHRASGYVLPESCVLVWFLQVKRKTFNHFPFSLMEEHSLV